MDPELYQAFKGKIQSLDNTATRLTLPEGTRPTTMKNRILRVASELNTPVTVRRVPGGLLFWRSTAEDLAPAKAVAQRLPPAQRKGRARALANAGAKRCRGQRAPPQHTQPLALPFGMHPVLPRGNLV
jgi:hypothetical protein